MSIQANRVLFRTLPGGVIIVCSTMPNTAAGRLTAPAG
jgi:hypothetical protein